MPVFFKPEGRVIAIHPVASCGDAEKWQKRAYGATIWVFRPRVRIYAGMRVLLVRIWYTLALAHPPALPHDAGTPNSEITP